jgi:protein CWC15
LQRVRAKYDDADDDDGGVSDDGGWSDLDNDGKAALADSDDSDLDDSDDDDSDDEDEEAALQAELAKIRSEREVTKAKEQAEVSGRDIRLKCCNTFS